MKKLHLFYALLLSLCFSQGLKAQEFRYDLGVDLGTSYYAGDLARKGFVAPQSFTAGFVARYKLNFRWAMRANLSYQGLRSRYAYAKNAFVGGRDDLTFSSSLVNLAYGMEFNFLPLSNKYRYLNTSSFSPYVYAGLGIGFAWGEDDTVFAPNVALGIGAKYQFSSRWTLSATWQWAYSFTDKLDALSKESEVLANPYQIKYGFLKGRDGFARITIGLSYACFRRADTNCAVPNVNL